MIEYHEPPRLAVGTRVRVRLSAECKELHPSETEGKEGWITDLPAPDAAMKDGHSYVVMYDKPYPDPSRSTDEMVVIAVGGAFAGGELEVLE